MPVMQVLKNNPLTVLFSSSGTIIAIVVAMFAVDERYAHAKDVQKYEQQTQKVITDSVLGWRKQVVEDKLFEYDIKKAQMPNNQLSPVDEAMRQRYQRQLDDLKSGKVN